jgi:hypothetical protein
LETKVKKNYRKIFVFIPLIIAMLISALIFAQTEVFAPFVTHAEARVKDRNVEITWKDSTSVKGAVTVYRSKTPFTDGSISNAEASVSIYYGRQNFNDEVPAGGTWYYLISASGENGEQYNMTIPYNNVIEVVVDGGMHLVQASGINAPETSMEAFSEASATPQEQVSDLSVFTGEGRPATSDFGNIAASSVAQPYAGSTFDSAGPLKSGGVPPPQYITPSVNGIPENPSTLMLTGLSAYPDGAGIRINFISANPSKHAVVYRNVAPILQLKDLLTAAVAALPGAASPFIDKVNVGVPCYYAVVYDEDLRGGSAYIYPGYNSTVYPVMVTSTGAVQVSAGPALPGSPPLTSSTIAAKPVTTNPSSGEKLSLEAAAALSKSGFTSMGLGNYPIASNVTDKQVALREIHSVMTEPRIFDEDVGGGANFPVELSDAELSNIVVNLILQRRWIEAALPLRTLSRSAAKPAVRVRAGFYLGQCLYFMGEYKSAITELLAVQSVFPDETNAWIKACLDSLEKK